MACEEAKAGRTLSKRAQRFAIELPLRFREKGTTGWLEGASLNISASGILFRSGSAVVPNTAIDLALVLPVTSAGEPAAEIVCHGIVVRNANDAGDGPVLAATFQRYRIAREGRKATA
jgi:hypothetical protein